MGRLFASCHCIFEGCKWLQLFLIRRQCGGPWRSAALLPRWVLLTHRWLWHWKAAPWEAGGVGATIEGTMRSAALHPRWVQFMAQAGVGRRFASNRLYFLGDANGCTNS